MKELRSHCPRVDKNMGTRRDALYLLVGHAGGWVDGVGSSVDMASMISFLFLPFLVYVVQLVHVLGRNERLTCMLVGMRCRLSLETAQIKIGEEESGGEKFARNVMSNTICRRTSHD